jgi:serine/threonine protein kinase
VLARYEILREVSRGRRATVYQALDREEDRTVALKVYDVDDAASMARLRAEARVLLDLVPHPALPIVRHSFIDKNQYVIVMDWIVGTDLEELLALEGDPGLPLDVVFDVLSQAAAAIDHLHAHAPPVVHGDVKPANLVRRDNGQIVLVDFGMAAEADSARVGTVGYVAPEVARGEKPTPAADVYGLAATAVALITGSPPHGNELVGPDIEPGQAAALSRTLRRALSVDPESRPSSAQAFVERLRTAPRDALPTGVVAMLALELAGSAALWDEHPAEMRTVSAQLADLIAGVVERDGRTVSSIADGGQALVVFRQASSAARAALRLHERVADQIWPPGMSVRLRAAIDVGEAEYRDGAYSGGAVDRVRWMRSFAPPGSTIVSRACADLLRGALDDDDVRVVSLGEVDRHELFALLASGDDPPRLLGPSAIEPVSPSALVPAPRHAIPTARIIGEAVQEPAALSSLFVFALSIVYVIVLAPEIGLGWLALLIAFGSGAVAAGAVVVGTRTGLEHRREVEAQEEALRELEQQERSQLEETERLRRELRTGFEALGADRAQQVLDALAHEYEAVRKALTRDDVSLTTSAARVLPTLADEMYSRGLRVLANAFEALHATRPRDLRRIEDLLEEARTNAAADPTDDALETVRGHEASLARLLELRKLADKLQLAAERCEAALRDMRMEVATMRADESEARVRTIVEAMEATLEQVRKVQEAYRRLER